MALKFNPAPNWPQPPVGWSPPAGWKPDPRWGPAPPGWQLWVDDAVEIDREQRVFISYRRSDAQAQANGLHDGLTHRLKSAKIFMDIDSIPAGVDFEDHIRGEIESCDLLLVVIGDNWLDPRPGSDIRRIDEPEDFVRLEIESALSSERVAILPVLVEGAQMPSRSELPDSIRNLGRINAIELSDSRWTADMQRLTTRIEELKQEQQARAAKGSTIVGQPLPPRFEPQRQPAPPPRYQPAPLPPGPPGPVVTQPRDTTWLLGAMIALPLCSCGLLAFAAPLWVGLRRGTDPALRRRMIRIAVALGIVAVVGFVIVGVSPTDDEGNAEGPWAAIGVIPMLVSAVIGFVVALVYRTPRSSLPGTERAIVQRRQRDEYRQLIARDIDLARNIHVGRPDLARDYDDGGLLDINSLTVQALVQFAPMSLAEAEQIVTARDAIGRLSSYDELLALTFPSEAVAARLRETAVFL